VAAAEHTQLKLRNAVTSRTIWLRYVQSTTYKGLVI